MVTTEVAHTLVKGTAALSVKNMLNTTFATKHFVECIIKLNSTTRGSLNTSIHSYSVVSEERIDPSTMRKMPLNFFGNMIAVVSLVRVIILSYIVWKLRLIEINLTILTIPQNHIAKCVLHKKSIGSNEVAVYFDTSGHLVM
jgi:hypothetical protein